MKEILNGVIKNTMLGEEDHGIFTAMLTIDMGGLGGGSVDIHLTNTTRLPNPE